MQLHGFLGASVAVMLLWSLRANVLVGIDYHLLGVVTLTLMFGPALALVATALALLGKAMVGQLPLESIPVNALVSAVPPILVTQLGLRLAQRHLSPHLFVYFFVNAFLAAAISAVIVGIAATGLAVGVGRYSFAALDYQLLPYLPLMAFAEALLNGVLTTALVVYAPHWVHSFSDSRYLGRR